MKRLTFLLLMWLLLALVGCGGNDEPAPTAAPPTPTPSPQDWLNGAIDAWNQSQSFHFSLVLENRTIPLDPSGTLAFGNAEGNVVAPDQFQSKTVVKTLLGNVEVGFIGIGDDQWLTNPLNGQWEKVEIASAIQVSDLFNQQNGIGKLVSDTANLERAADETIEGVETIHLRGDLPGSVLADFAPELANQDKVNIDLWISQSDTRIQKLVITEPPTDGISPIWTFLFTQYDAVPAIEPPI
ncbi:MAG: LppX_LprAFG lipoprotein [Ardenticatenaceae bacterium]